MNGLKIKFLGACGTVTGSSYFLSNSSGRGIVVDLGMFQGKKEEEKFSPIQRVVPTLIFLVRIVYISPELTIIY